MNTHFRSAELSLQLKRWPAHSNFPNLQAWDAVDELLLTKAFECIQTNKPTSVLVLNDQFGALSCALLAAHPELIIWHHSDSRVSQLACQHNIAANHLDSRHLHFISSMQPCPTQPDLVLMRIPRVHGYVQYQLQQLAQVITQQTQLLIAAKAKDIHKNLLQLFSETLGPTTASLTIKKCRLLQCQPEWPLPEAVEHWPKQWPVADQGIQLFNHANVFSSDKLDIGARFFLTHLPDTMPGQTLIDLGCGNGILGLSALLANPELKVIFCDESYMAVESARLSVTENAPHLLGQCTFRVDDGLAQQDANSADWVVCNPPFHQQQTITTHLATQMFAEAKRVLKPGGYLRIVANRHLPYGQQLKRIFSGCRCLASQAKFIILESQLRSNTCD
ncbi:MAG: methyltransferase [Alkalimonas sp.]|nr:methyltransferase [Alkalimonas sp.]